MKIRSISVTGWAVLLACALGYSQPLAVEVTERPTPYGGKILIVQNVSEQAIVAIAVTSHDYDSLGRLCGITPEIHDSAVDIRRGQLVQPIAPGETWSFDLPATLPGGRLDTAVRAVLLGDGTSQGGPLWIQKLLDRRKGALSAARAIRGLLDAARRNKTPKAALADKLRRLERTLIADLHIEVTRNIPPEEALRGELIGIEEIFVTVAGLLDKHSVSMNAVTSEVVVGRVQDARRMATDLITRLEANPPARLLPR